MLSPDYLLKVSEGGEAIAETLHDEIIKQIVERIAIRLDRGDNYILTARDKWQIQVLQEAGYLREDIEKILARYTALMDKEIAEAMEEAGVKSMDYDDAIYRAAGLDPTPLTQSPYLTRLLQRGYEATSGEWYNFTRTMADECQRKFIQECDKAYNMVASGASGYGQAYLDAINSIAEDGVVVTYTKRNRDGSIRWVRTETIESATLRCIRTGVSQATGQITDARMDEMNWDIVLVSSHLGARMTEKEDYTNHYWWQGKFYSRSGEDKRFPPYSVCGFGKMLGIHGVNCRHQHMPGDGEFNPFDQYDSEENRKEYELQQRQRVMERRIRDSKRKCMGLKHGLDSATTDEAKALLEKEYQKEAALLQDRNKAYDDFCKDNDLKKKHERITIAKWDRQQAKNARIAANRRKKELENPQKSGKMKIDTGGRRNERSLSETQIDRAKEAAYRQGYVGDIYYRDYSSTSFHAFSTFGHMDSFHYLVIGTDAYPNATPEKSAVERISIDGCMAHEVIGHYEAWKRGTTQSTVFLEEAQASMRASKFGVGLTAEERAILWEDGIDRLRLAGMTYDEVKDLLDIWER